MSDFIFQIQKKKLGQLNDSYTRINIISVGSESNFIWHIFLIQSLHYVAKRQKKQKSGFHNESNFLKRMCWFYSQRKYPMVQLSKCQSFCFFQGSKINKGQCQAMCIHESSSLVPAAFILSILTMWNIKSWTPIYNTDLICL